MYLFAFLTIATGLLLLVFFLWRTITIQTAVQSRLSQDEIDEEVADLPLRELPARGIVSGWLYRAGFRRPEATMLFWTATIALGLIGLGIMYSLWRQGFFIYASDFVSSIPGGVGNVMVPFVLATPWFLVVVLTLIPSLIVRSVRRARVRSVEQDLPLLLDLLNTLAQAGIGFDSALDQILGVQNQKRPLVMELRTFQYDNLAGRSRIESLRSLMRRVEVPIFSTFISAIVQAEQTGAGTGPTLKTQSAEMRSRRREKASAAAMSVPTLLVVPMVIGFLPGIFVVLLGPMLYEAFGVMEQSFRGVLGQ